MRGSIRLAISLGRSFPMYWRHRYLHVIFKYHADYPKIPLSAVRPIIGDAITAVLIGASICKRKSNANRTFLNSSRMVYQLCRKWIDNWKVNEVGSKLSNSMITPYRSAIKSMAPSITIQRAWCHSSMYALRHKGPNNLDRFDFSLFSCFVSFILTHYTVPIHSIWRDVEAHSDINNSLVKQTDLLWEVNMSHISWYNLLIILAVLTDILQQFFIT